MLKSTNRLEFTDKWLRDLEIPTSGRTSYYDTISPTLVLIVTAKGAKTFYRAGRPSRIYIGHPDQGWTVANARTQCNIINGEIASGKNPLAARRKKRSDKTLGQAWAWYLENYAKLHKRTWKTDQRQWEWLRDWENMKLASLTRDKFIERLNALISSKGENRARHEMSLLNSILTQARKNRWIKRHPGRGVPLPRPRERDRSLQAEEIPVFFQKLGARPQDFQDQVIVAAFTGARRDNVQSMRWEEIAGDVWTIPASKAKEKKAIAIPLLAPVLEILKRRRKSVDSVSPWVFPSKHSKSGYVTTALQHQWKNLLRETKIKDLRPHDLRHTIATFMIDRNISKEIIAKSLGHADVKSTDIYAKVNLEPVRAAMQIGADAILKAASPKKSKKSRK